MEVRIQAIHFDATEKLQDFIQKKTAKLEKYCDDINKVEVSLKVVKPETAMNKEASIKVLVPNGEFFAEKVSDTFEESVDVCVDQRHSLPRGDLPAGKRRADGHGAWIHGLDEP